MLHYQNGGLFGGFSALEVAADDCSVCGNRGQSEERRRAGDGRTCLEKVEESSLGLGGNCEELAA